MNLLDIKNDTTKKIDSDIKILQLLKSGDQIRFVEFRSNADGRDHIMNVDRFTEIFGYTLEDLEEIE